MFVACAGSLAPVRIMENTYGEAIESATFSTPIRIIGWSSIPLAGMPFVSFSTRKEAAVYTTEHASSKKQFIESNIIDKNKAVIPIIIKADSTGSLEGVIGEIKKLPTDRAVLKILSADVGPVSDKDIQPTLADKRTLIVAFSTPINNNAKRLADREGIDIHSFDIIYKLSEWLEKAFTERIPKIETEEITGSAKVLIIFSQKHDKQVIGCRVNEGMLAVGETVKIIRRDNEIGKGHLREIQQQKNKVSEINEDTECGILLESRIEVAPGDILKAFQIVKK